MFRPSKVIILGITYQIEYVEKVSEVDIDGRKPLWGQIDYWTRSIRIYANKNTENDVFITLIHEIIHGICEALKIEEISENEKVTHLLALALSDIFVTNNWLKIE